MIETFIALLLAHTLADFVFQPDWMNANKRRPGVMLLHGVIVLLTAQAALGTVASTELLLLAAAHVAIDCVKTYGNFRGVLSFLADQAAHLATLAAVAAHAPSLWHAGAIATWLPGLSAAILAGMALAAGLVLSLRAGDFAIQTLMADHSLTPRETNTGAGDTAGLPGGGRTIGYLERLLIFVLILSGQFGAIGFLVAAKSILRFGTISGDRKATEYVIIGTLASFGWAIAAAQATAGLLSMLPRLEIGAIGS